MHEDNDVRRCDLCGRKLYASPIPRDITWHGLRRVGASLYKQAGTDGLVRKLLMGHAVTDITDDVYTVVSEDFMRNELNKLSLRTAIGLGGPERPFDSTPGPRTSNPRVAGSSPAGRNLLPDPSHRIRSPRGLRRPMLTPQEVATELAVDRETVYRLISAGQLPAVRVGSLWRISREALDEYLFGAGGGDQ